MSARRSWTLAHCAIAVIGAAATWLYFSGAFG